MRHLFLSTLFFASTVNFPAGAAGMAREKTLPPEPIAGAGPRVCTQEVAFLSHPKTLDCVFARNGCSIQDWKAQGYVECGNGKCTDLQRERCIALHGDAAKDMRR